MAQDRPEASVASSSPPPNWWEVHANPFSSWNSATRWQQPPPSYSCEEDFSVSTTSLTSAAAPSMDSPSSMDLATEPAENHLWSQVLLSIGSGGYLHNGHDDGENFVEALSSQTPVTEITFDSACDYLKKLGSGWGFPNPPSLNSLEKQLNGYDGSPIERERPSDVSDWSIAPPSAQLDHRIAPSTCNGFINPSMPQYSMSNISRIKHELPNAPPYPAIGAVGDRNTDYMLCSTDGVGYGIGLNNSVIGLDNKFSSYRNLSDVISSSGCLNRPRKASYLSDSKKQGFETSSSTRGSGRGSGTPRESKKKRSEYGSETLLKKSKHESSTVSSIKMQAPKVKLGDRISALQQIVSPFGKTDTASVLLEAINYIRFLHGQVQLLSDPYMKMSANKDHNSWGGLERKEKAESKIDLRSRGLSLVPVSSTSQVYQENTGPDYWTPTYRGCLYR